MSAPIGVTATAGPTVLSFTSSISSSLLAVVPWVCGRRRAFPPLFELAREAGEARPVGDADRPHIHSPPRRFAAACGSRGSGAGAPRYRSRASQSVSVVHILVTGQPPEYRLPQQPDQQMTSVPAGARPPPISRRRLRSEQARRPVRDRPAIRHRR